MAPLDATTVRQRSMDRFLLNGAQLLPILCFSGYLAWQNMFLSADWWLLPIRSIDDLATNTSTDLMRQAIVTLDFDRFITFFDYAYGAGYWLLMVFLTTPSAFLDEPTIQILIGRLSSLAAMVGTAVVVALMGGRLFPFARSMIPACIALGLITPIGIVNATKMHVNSWVTLFGSLALLVLIWRRDITTNKILLSACLLGISVGFKLTGILLLPIYFVVLWVLRKQLSLKQVALAGTIFTLSALSSMAPFLLWAPLDMQKTERFVATLKMFASLGSTEGMSPLSQMWTGFEYYHQGVVFVVLTGLLFLLGARADLVGSSRLGRAIALASAVVIVIGWSLVPFLVSKGSLYIATYLLSPSSLLPIGLFGIACYLKRPILQVTTAWAILLVSIVTNGVFQATVLANYNFASISQRNDTQQIIAAARGMESVVSTGSGSVRVLQDSSALFPASNLDEGYTITIVYGNLADFSASSVTEPFDYVVLNNEGYFGQPDTAEEDARKQFEVTGMLSGTRFILVYSNGPLRLFERVQSADRNIGQ